jgi:hypothetical protein
MEYAIPYLLLPLLGRWYLLPLLSNTRGKKKIDLKTDFGSA